MTGHPRNELQAQKNPPSSCEAGHQPEEKAPPSRDELLLLFPAHPGFVQATPF